MLLVAEGWTRFHSSLVCWEVVATAILCTHKKRSTGSSLT